MQIARDSVLCVIDPEPLSYRERIKSASIGLSFLLFLYKRLDGPKSISNVRFFLILILTTQQHRSMPRCGDAANVDAILVAGIACGQSSHNGGDTVRAVRSYGFNIGRYELNVTA